MSAPPWLPPGQPVAPPAPARGRYRCAPAGHRPPGLVPEGVWFTPLSTFYSKSCPCGAHAGSFAKNRWRRLERSAVFKTHIGPRPGKGGGRRRQRPGLWPRRRGPWRTHTSQGCPRIAQQPRPQHHPLPCSLFPDPALGLRSPLGRRLGRQREPQEEVSGGREGGSGWGLRTEPRTRACDLEATTVDGQQR